MNKNKSYIGNLLRYAAVVLLTVILFFDNSVKADETAFHSDIIGFSVSIPDGYEYAGDTEGKEIFIKGSYDNLQYILVSLEENSGITGEMLQFDGDTIMETVIASYESDGSVISNEQSYGYREFGETQKGWLGFGLVKDGEHVDMFLMNNNQSDLYSVYFVNVTEDARVQFINSFVLDNSSNDIGFSSSAEADYSIQPSENNTLYAEEDEIPDSAYDLVEGKWKYLGMVQMELTIDKDGTADMIMLGDQYDLTWEFTDHSKIEALKDKSMTMETVKLRFLYRSNEIATAEVMSHGETNLGMTFVLDGTDFLLMKME